MRKSFFQEVLSQRPMLFQAMLEFNSPRDVWPETAINGDALAARLWSHCPRSRSLLLTMLPGQASFWDFGEESRRLALVPTSKLSAAVRLFAVGLHARSIAHTILRSSVSALRKNLGDELYLYALNHGQYQTGDAAKVFAGRDIELPLHDRIVLHGRQALAACAFRWPEDLTRCIAPILDISPDHSGLGEDELAFVLNNPTALRTVWFGLKKTLLKEVDPSWAPCFD